MKKLLIIIIVMIMTIVSSCKTISLFDYIINKVVEITCENEITKSYRTGTLISKDGLILTNKHIVYGVPQTDTSYSKELVFIYSKGCK